MREITSARERNRFARCRNSGGGSDRTGADRCLLRLGQLSGHPRFAEVPIALSLPSIVLPILEELSFIPEPVMRATNRSEGGGLVWFGDPGGVRRRAVGFRFRRRHCLRSLHPRGPAPRA